LAIIAKRAIPANRLNAGIVWAGSLYFSPSPLGTVLGPNDGLIKPDEASVSLRFVE
jgi:hypothetical protein